MPFKCVLCHHANSQRLPSRHHLLTQYSCPRCGSYYIADLAFHQSGAFGGDGPFRMACVASEFRLKHTTTSVPGFVLTDDWKLDFSVETALPTYRIYKSDEMLKAFPSGAELTDRSLLNLARLVQHPVDVIAPGNDDLQYILFCPSRNLLAHVMLMEGMGTVERVNNSPDNVMLRITPSGWQRIQELSRLPSESKQGFVAMWFDPSMDAFYEQGIRPAIEDDANLTCRKIDLKEHNNKICDEIIAEIRKSRFVVADFTAGYCSHCEDCQKKPECKRQVMPRGGVYFEAGMAMGLGIPVIWTVHKDQIGQVHFDTRQYNHIVYESPEELRRKLYNRIASTISMRQ